MDSLLGLASVYKSTVKMPFVVSMTTDMIWVLKTAAEDGELLADVENSEEWTPESEKQDKISNVCWFQSTELN